MKVDILCGVFFGDERHETGLEATDNLFSVRHERYNQMLNIKVDEYDIGL